MRAGTKNVEYRDLTDFYLKQLYKKDKDGNYAIPKPLSHILLQGGYNPDSPRVLIELKGWVINKAGYPLGLDPSGHELYSDTINLLLGKIVYDSM